MSDAIEVVAKVAATPAQAQVLVALLRAEGIPARIEGESLTDEFAASRRLMNLLGVKIMVPAASVVRARELMTPADVDPDELTRQALAAKPDPPPDREQRTEPVASAMNTLRSLTGTLLVGMVLILVLACVLLQR